MLEANQARALLLTWYLGSPAFCIDGRGLSDASSLSQGLGEHSSVVS